MPEGRVRGTIEFLNTFRQRAARQREILFSRHKFIQVEQNSRDCRPRSAVAHVTSWRQLFLKNESGVLRGIAKSLQLGDQVLLQAGLLAGLRLASQAETEGIGKPRGVVGWGFPEYPDSHFLSRLVERLII